MSDYKNYLLRQLGIKESSINPSSLPQTDADLNEIEDASPESGDFFARLKKDGQKDTIPKMDTMISPTGAKPFIAIAVRGSNTGGLPSGADRNMSVPHVDGIDVKSLTRGQLGGYEAIPIDHANSELINKTPPNPQINSSSPKIENPQTSITPHPHQIQRSKGEAPQAVTGASTESDPSLKVGTASPKGVDVDVDENEEETKSKQKAKATGMDETFTRHLRLMNESISEFGIKEKVDEGKHKSGCQCGFCKNKGGFGKKKEDSNDKTEETPSDDENTEKEDVKEVYSAPFSRMQNLANIGIRKGMKNGLWENNKVGAENPFITHWKMDKEKAGMVKIDEAKLNTIKESLTKKKTLSLKEARLLELVKKLSEKKSR